MLRDKDRPCSGQGLSAVYLPVSDMSSHGAHCPNVFPCRLLSLFMAFVATLLGFIATPVLLSFG